jgi:hypothetical protein
MFGRSVLKVPILLALAYAVAVAACGGAATKGAPGGSPAPTQGQALAPAAPVPTDVVTGATAAVPGTPAAASPPAGSSPTPTPSGATPTPRPTLKPTPKPTLKPIPAPKPNLVTVKGAVTAIFANGNFLLIGYTVVMTPTTSVVNLDGHQVPVQFVQVGNLPVKVTGRRSGSTIEAEQVVVQTHKDT